MRKTRPINIEDLQEEAERSEHREAFRVLERKKDYRIGIGVRLDPTSQPSFFLEVLLYLCPESSQVNIPLLEKNLIFLKELKARGYCLACEDSNCISCETIVSSENPDSEYEAVRLIAKNVFHR